MNVLKRATAAAVCTLAVGAGTVVTATPAEAARTIKVITGWNQSDCTYYAKQYAHRMVANGTYRSALREPCVKKGSSTWQARIQFFS